MITRAISTTVIGGEDASAPLLQRFGLRFLVGCGITYAENCLQSRENEDGTRAYSGNARGVHGATASKP